jgi:hypothetical protein
LLTLLGYSLVRLLVDGFLDQSDLLGGVRVSQIFALIVALGAMLLLARGERAEDGDSIHNTSTTGDE